MKFLASKNFWVQLVALVYNDVAFGASKIRQKVL